MALLQVYGSSNDVEIGYSSGVSVSWNNVVNVFTTGSYINSAAATNFKVRSDAQGGVGTYYNSRIYMYFDTSSLPDNAVILSATLDVYQEAQVSSTNIQPIHAVVGTFAAGALAVTDYGALNKSQRFGSNNLGSGARTITFDASGYQYINKLGFTKIVLVTDNDYTNSAPSSGSTERSKTLSSQNNGVVGQRPLLSINYTLANPYASYLT